MVDGIWTFLRKLEPCSKVSSLNDKNQCHDGLFNLSNLYFTREQWRIWIKLIKDSNKEFRGLWITMTITFLHISNASLILRLMVFSPVGWVQCYCESLHAPDLRILKFNPQAGTKKWYKFKRRRLREMKAIADPWLWPCACYQHVTIGIFPVSFRFAAY